jgi:hypothetical protein
LNLKARHVAETKGSVEWLSKGESVHMRNHVRDCNAIAQEKARSQYRG